MKILILYHSKTGHTLEAVNAVAKGIRGAGSDATITAVKDFTPDTFAGYDGLILGSPCWAGSITRSGIAKPLVRAVEAMPEDSLRNRRCGGIAVHSKTGGAHTVQALGELLSRKGCTDYRRGPVAKAGVPFSIFKGTSVSSEDEKDFASWGAKFVA